MTKIIFSKLNDRLTKQPTHLFDTMRLDNYSCFNFRDIKSPYIFFSRQVENNLCPLRFQGNESQCFLPQNSLAVVAMIRYLDLIVSALNLLRVSIYLVRLKNLALQTSAYSSFRTQSTQSQDETLHSLCFYFSHFCFVKLQHLTRWKGFGPVLMVWEWLL